MPLAAAMVLGFGVRFASAEKISGVLIDTKCAAKFSDEKAAEKHPAKCAASCSKKADMVLFSGDKQLKLDEKGQELAKAYIQKADAKTKVTITGEKSGDEIKVESIQAAE
jgi:hypothetical protein